MGNRTNAAALVAGNKFPENVNIVTLALFVLNALVYWGTKIKKRLQSNEAKIENLARRLQRYGSERANK